MSTVVEDVRERRVVQESDMNDTLREYKVRIHTPCHHVTHDISYCASTMSDIIGRTLCHTPWSVPASLLHVVV